MTERRAAVLFSPVGMQPAATAVAVKTTWCVPIEGQAGHCLERFAVPLPILPVLPGFRDTSDRPQRVLCLSRVVDAFLSQGRSSVLPSHFFPSHFFLG
ncbi:MAG: hypothetical protein ACE5JX_11795 [Acidobacteriota bacterium]